MMARKAFAVFLLGACLALSSALTGCGLLGPAEPAQPEKPPMSVADAQKAIEAAKSKLVPPERLDRANEELSAARRKAEELKDKWDKLRAATLRARPPRNPDDRRDAPITVAAGETYQQAADEARAKSQALTDLSTRDRQAREELRNAEAALAAAQAGGGEVKPSPQQPPVPAEGTLGVASWLSMLLTLSCLGLLGFLLWKVLGLERDLRHLRGLVRESHDKQIGGLQKLNTSVSVLNEGPNTLANLMGELVRLRDWMYTDRQERLKESKLAAARDANNPAYGVPQRPAPPPVYEEVVDFPISAGTFLSRVSGQQQMPIKLDPLKGILVRDQEGLGLLMLVRDGSVYGGQLCMVPGMTHLQTEQDFHYNYEKFYDCGRPSAGEVWISKPALVDKVDGGWRLLEKGQLEVRS